MNIEIASENALIIYLGETISDETSLRVQSIAQRLPQLMGSHLLDLIPSYASLLVIFNPLTCDHQQVRQWLIQANTQSTESAKDNSRLVQLPVYYSEESGPDLPFLAEQTGLTPKQIIDLHQQTDYRVYAIGFAPGFAYLGEIDKRLATPRRPTPRPHVPKGTVAIADRQTAVYPAASPGGWHLIGLCPTPMFDPQATPSTPVAVGDQVRFTEIDRHEFLSLGGELPAEQSGAAY